MSEILNLQEMINQIVKKYKRKDALYYEGKTVTYKELDENSNKAANVLSSLGIKKHDRVALMLPNTPEFVYAFIGIQKIGAVAVPFNTMYKGREITYILNDCGAKVLICQSSFANLINEIRDDVPELKHIILTGQRTLLLVSPESTVNIQIVCGKEQFSSSEDAFQLIGELLVETLKGFQVNAWYKHWGGVRVGGKKIATVLVSKLENLLIINTVIFIGPMETDDLFKAIWVSPEVKDKVIEPSTSILEETGQKVNAQQFAEVFLNALKEKTGIDPTPGQLKRDELFGFEKIIALSK